MTVITTFQENLPVFVRDQHNPFIYKGKTYKFNEQVPWLEIGMSNQDVTNLFAIDRLYHNTKLEKETKVGDRLSEMNKAQLDKLVRLLNDIVKKKTASAEEFRQKKCKFSKLEDKQRALVRQFLNRSAYITEDFYEIRDSILGE